ncbi:MAG: hypothetical protein AB2L07_03145 [Thermoanaerobaculaceae bacterium]
MAAMPLPQHIQSNAEGYIALTEDTIESLAFLLDNIGDRVVLDLSPESVESLELILHRIHAMPDPNTQFPDLLEIFAQLLAQYCALANLRLTNARWGVDDTPRSAMYGQPFVEVVPTEPWRRFYPIHWQNALRDPRAALSTSVSSLARQVADNVAARAKYENLIAAISQALDAAPGSALGESELVDALRLAKVAPDPQFFAAAARAFPKRVAAVLRKSGEFSNRRPDRRWQIKPKRVV